jgi:hypothetical protein
MRQMIKLAISWKIEVVTEKSEAKEILNPKCNIDFETLIAVELNL